MSPPEGLSPAEEASWYAGRAQDHAAAAQRSATQALLAALLAMLIALAAVGAVVWG